MAKEPKPKQKAKSRPMAERKESSGRSPTNLWLSDEERERVTAIREFHGLGREADAIRLAINETWRRVVLEQENLKKAQ